MKQLTYADRELMLQTFDSLRETWSGSDEQLLDAALEWAKRLAPAYGFEHALTRDVTVLSRYLLEQKDLVRHRDEQYSFPRAAFAYLLRERDVIADGPGMTGCLDHNPAARMAIALIDSIHENYLERFDLADSARLVVNASFRGKRHGLWAIVPPKGNAGFGRSAEVSRLAVSPEVTVYANE